MKRFFSDIYFYKHTYNLVFLKALHDNKFEDASTAYKYLKHTDIYNLEDIKFNKISNDDK
jgi:hypothetical protein